MKSINNKFGVSTILFRELSLARALEKISHAGFNKIDLAIIPPKFCPHYFPLATTKEDDKKIRELLEKYHLEVSTLNIVPGYFNQDNPEIVKRFIRRCVEIAVNFNASTITIPSGIKAKNSDWFSHVKMVKDPIIEEAKYACDYGIAFSIEAPHVGTLAETVEQAKTLFEIMDSELIKCTLDTSHVFRGEDTSLVEGIDSIGLDMINHFHLRDVIGEEIIFTPGKGHCDFKEFFQKINKSEYQGDFIFELEYEDLSENKKIRELHFAYKYCSLLYSKKVIPYKLRFISGRFYQCFERFLNNPKAEIRRHRNILGIARKVYPFFLKSLPDIVYEGRWLKKYRFRKNKSVRFRTKNVKPQQTSQEKLKVGIIGCGWAGMEMHGPGYARLNNVQIIGAYDIDTQKSFEFSKRFGGEAFDSLDTLIHKGKPDIVSICSREWAHYEATVYSLKNKVDVFCEKLMATRYQHAKEMVKLAEQYDRVLGINYNYRFMPGIKKLKEIIDHKVLGALSFFNINVHAFAYAHALDLLSFLGGKITSVSGSFVNDDNERLFRGTDWSLYDEDILYIPSIYASVACEFERGYVGNINSSIYYDLEAFILSIEAVFQNGAVTLNGINMFNAVGDLSYISKSKVRRIDMNHKKGIYSKGFEFSFFSSIEEFINSYSKGEKPDVPGEQGLFNIDLERAIAKSNSEKTKILI